MNAVRSIVQPSIPPDTEIPTGLFVSLACIICLVGALLRLYVYGHHATLWMDEAMLAVNIRDASWRQLFGALPYYDQAAPLLYLLFSKVTFALFGATDWIARLVPLATGFSILIIALCIPGLSRTERVGFVFLIAFNADLIRYSAEAKQYGPEALVGLLFYIASKKLASAPDTRSTVLYLVTGVVAMMSATLFPLLFAASIVPIVLQVRQHPMRWRVATAAALLCIVYGVYYLLVFHPAIIYQKQNYLFTYTSFPHLAGNSLGFLFRQIGSEFTQVFGLSAGRITAVLFIGLGLVVLLRRSSWNFETTAMAALFLSCLVLNLLHVLPIENRRWFVFLIPWTSAFCVVTIAGFPRGVRFLATALFAVCMIYESGVYCISLPLADSRRTLTYLQETDQVETAMISYAAQPLFDFYYDPFSRSCINQSLLKRGFVNRCTARILPYPRTMNQLRIDAAQAGVWSNFDAATLAAASEDIRNDPALLESGFTQLSVNYRADLVERRSSSPQLIFVHLDTPLWIQWFTDALNTRGLTTTVVIDERNRRGRELAGELLLVKHSPK